MTREFFGIKPMVRGLLAAALAATCTATSAGATEIRIVASPSIKGVLTELAPQFEKATGNTLVISYGLIAAQKQQIEAGGFDLAITPSDVIDLEVKQGKIGSQTHMLIARTGLGVGARAGTPKPDIASADAFKQALLNAKSVSFIVNEPSGQQISADFERLGIGAALAPKIIPQDSVTNVWQAVAKGDAELGFGFSTNIVSASGVEFVGPFPHELQLYTELAAGIAAASPQAEAAKALVAFLLGPDASPVMTKNGFELAGR